MGIYRIVNAILFSLLLTAQILANVAAPFRNAELAGEPGGLKNVTVKSEKLNIDFRHLADEPGTTDFGKVDFEANYDIESASNNNLLNPVFLISQKNKASLHLWLDEVEIFGVPVFDDDSAKLSPQWKKPTSTPAFNGRTLEFTPSVSLTPVKIPLALSAGKHHLKVVYQIDASSYTSTPVKYWQSAYVFSPAAEWTNFDNLELSIQVPTNWKFSSSTPLQRNDDVLTEKFKSVPAESIAMTLQYPLPESYSSSQGLYFLLFLVSLIGFPIIMIVFGAWKGYKLKFSWAYGFLFGLIWGALILGSGYLMVFGADKTLPAGQYSEFGYGSAFGMLAVIVFAGAGFLVGALLWILVIFIMSKIKKTPMG